MSSLELPAASSPLPSPASSPAPSPPSPPSASSSSPLTPLISSTRSLLEGGVERVAESERLAVRYYNGSIARQGNRQLEGLRGGFHHLRHEWGGWLVVGAVATVAAVSLPFGRFAAARNAALAGLLTGWTAFPATVTGLLVATTESIQSAPALAPAWTRKGEQAVRAATPEMGGDRLPGTFSRAGDGHSRASTQHSA